MAQPEDQAISGSTNPEKYGTPLYFRPSRRCLLRAVKPISRSQWNDGYGADSGRPRGDPCTPALRPFATSPLGGTKRWILTTSSPRVFCIADEKPVCVSFRPRRCGPFLELPPFEDRNVIGGTSHARNPPDIRLSASLLIGPLDFTDKRTPPLCNQSISWNRKVKMKLVQKTLMNFNRLRL